MRHELLIVEDDPHLRALACRAVSELDVAVVEAATGAEALGAMRGRPVDIALVDLGLPDLSGIQILSELRRLAPDLHLIVLSADHREVTRLRSFAAGADDFLQKPYSSAELAARVVVGMRRRRRVAEGVLTFDDLVIDLAARSAFVGEVNLALPKREFELLAHFALNPRRIFTRDDLLHAVWGSSAEFQGEETITEHVGRLRKRLEPLAEVGGWIETIRGIGYRFDPIPGAPAAPKRAAEEILRAKGSIDVTLDQSGAVRAVSDGAIEFFGAITSEELLGHPFLELVAPVSLEVMQHRARSVREGEWPEPLEVLFQRRDGSIVNGDVTGPAGGDVGDHTEVNIWPAGTRKSQLLQGVLTGISSEVSDAVIVTGADYRIRSFNPAAERMYGWAEAEVTGELITEVLTWVGDDEALTVAQRELHENGVWIGEACQRTRDGGVVEVRGTVTNVCTPDGSPFAVIAVNRPVGSRPASSSLPRRAPGLEQALEEPGAVVPYFQPVVRLHDRKVVGYEALARLVQPDGDVVEAASFVPRAEREGLVRKLDALMLPAACAQLGRWLSDGRDWHLAVNTSAAHIADPGFPDLVAECIDRYSLPAGTLWLEVTETSLVADVDQAARALAAAVDSGAKISIDDFGTGWAGLTYLNRFPVSGLKIDQTFVSRLGTGGSEEAIVRSILTLAKELSLAVVAEGIETDLQSVTLRALGCTVGQGFLFGHPTSVEGLDAQA